MNLDPENLRDEAWTLRNLFAIRPKVGPVVGFRPNHAQEWLLKRWHARNNILKARKMGFSTLLAMMALNKAMFGKRQECVLVDKTMDDAVDKLRMAREAYQLAGLFCPALEKLEDRQELNRSLHALSPLTKDSTTELQWANGSSLKARTSLRGGNPHWVHVSELGHISLEFPKRAAEIRSGTVESVAAGNTVTLESTHKGGKFGVNYELIREEEKNAGKDDLDDMQWRLHFFPWFFDEANRIGGAGPVRLSEEHTRYFVELERKLGRTFDHPQKRWWSQKRHLLGHDMAKEHPSTVEEALAAPTEGAIYAETLATLRSQGRVHSDPFEIDPRYPCYVSWDLGRSDYTSMWVVQIRGEDILWVDWFEDSGEEASYYAGIAREWAIRYPIQAHILPHDAAHQHFNGASAAQVLKECGLPNQIINPRIPRVWDGINELRRLLVRSRFHPRCVEAREVNGEKLPSGFDHLEAYRRHVAEAGSVLRDQPVHDEHSHSADAARAFAEAFARGAVSPTVKPKRRGKPQQAILG